MYISNECLDELMTRLDQVSYLTAPLWPFWEHVQFSCCIRENILVLAFSSPSCLVSAVVPGQPRPSLPVQLSVSIPLKITAAHLFALAAIRQQNTVLHPRFCIRSFLTLSGVNSAYYVTPWFCCSRRHPAPHSAVIIS